MRWLVIAIFAIIWTNANAFTVGPFKLGMTSKDARGKSRTFDCRHEPRRPNRMEHVACTVVTINDYPEIRQAELIFDTKGWLRSIYYYFPGNADWSQFEGFLSDVQKCVKGSSYRVGDANFCNLPKSVVISEGRQHHSTCMVQFCDTPHWFLQVTNIPEDYARSVKRKRSIDAALAEKVRQEKIMERFR